MNIIDSSGWMHYFMNGHLAEQYAGYVSNLKKIVTPTIVFYEVHRKIKKEVGKEAALDAVAQLQETTVVPLTDSLAYLASNLSLEHKLTMADAIIYATALDSGVELITSDADFKNLPSVTYIAEDE